jgi:hypothetical protein
MTTPGYPALPVDTVHHIARIGKRLDELARKPHIPTPQDFYLYGDVFSSGPRDQLNVSTWVNATLNVPVAVLRYSPVDSAPISTLNFAVANSNVSAANMLALVYVGQDPSALTLLAENGGTIAASTPGLYSIYLGGTVSLPAGFVLLAVMSTTVGANIPQLVATGNVGSNVFAGKNGEFTAMVGSTTMPSPPSTLSVLTSNTAVWSASSTPVWASLSA